MSQELEQKARWLFKQESKFLAAANNFKAIPNTTLPEVALIGRSNVGKSSLVNALTKQSKLARTSKTPGRTKQLIFFTIATQGILVDLPGYGYAKASQAEIQAWNKLIFKYFQTRANLKRVYILIDSRHGIKLIDKEVMEILDEIGISYQLVFTKLDKSTKNDLECYIKEINSFKEHHAAMHPDLLFTSAKANNGLDQFRIEIAKVLMR